MITALMIENVVFGRWKHIYDINQCVCYHRPPSVVKENKNIIGYGVKNSNTGEMTIFLK